MENQVQETKSLPVNDVAVLGLGPSGVAACIELVKNGYKPVAYEPGLIGGQVNMTANVRNYPGFSGPAFDLTSNFASDVKALNITVIRSMVKSLTRTAGDLFLISSSKGDALYRSVIVATGNRFRPYGIPDTSKQVHGHGFSRCAICDGPLYKGKDVLVVGGGQSAFQEGLYLSSICHHVTLINRRDVFRATEKEVNAFKNRPNTTIITPAVTVSCSGTNNHLEHVVIKDPNDLENKTLRTLDVVAVFIYIGFNPATSFVQIPLAKDDKDQMKVDEDMKVEAVKGLLGSGDVIDTPLRQIATAVGYGAKAGVSAARYLRSGNW